MLDYLTLFHLAGQWGFSLADAPGERSLAIYAHLGPITPSSLFYAPTILLVV